ncbi:uncharacterized protein Dana_GF17414 [Drosophila ananassae]|uniref:CHK kinase-like domain-containing protein n=1 Tax=Drosophila ananassae TaxID=7217 RepID=B3LWM4_DROAN|nr:uncharacterized protein LOC6500198 [Drosophila ananassae]EDV41618.1 uncharacterized protein Dana_GF17414 [Drosophila ananassae]
MPPQTKDEEVDGRDVLIPEWVKPNAFEDLLKKEVKDFKQTKSLRAKAGVSAGENYATVMLRVELDVETKDEGLQTKAFMLKTPHQSEAYRKIIEKTDVFDVERGMYLEVVPELEKLYRDVGVEVTFGAKAYELPAGDYYVLLEDLRPRGFRNADRLQGLDQTHTENVLRKFAQWHAASAVRVETKGPFEPKYTAGLFKTKDLVDALCTGSAKTLLKHVDKYEGHKAYIEDLTSVSKKLFEVVDDLNTPKSDEFNALNHGDGWSNNIMFQYNDKNEILNTYFVDLQIPKYGTVAQDLYYFLLSSTQLDIKTSKFDYFIWFYHTELVKHLKLLNYSKPLPSLRSLHDALNRYSGWAFICCACIMGYVLLDPTEEADFDKLLANEDSTFKQTIFTNPRYKKHMEVLLPWLHHRGALS